MPPLGKLLGHADFSNLFISLNGEHYDTIAAAKAAGAATLNYGLFINAVVNFLIVAFAIFLLVRAVNRMRKAEPAAAPTTRECPRCLSSVPLKATRCAFCTSDLAGS
jgi:large conductance mechanosensitive channel